MAKAKEETKKKKAVREWPAVYISDGYTEKFEVEVEGAGKIAGTYRPLAGAQRARVFGQFLKLGGPGGKTDVSDAALAKMDFAKVFDLQVTGLLEVLKSWDVQDEKKNPIEIAKDNFGNLVPGAVSALFSELCGEKAKKKDGADAKN